jgi:hypothetical protein
LQFIDDRGYKSNYIVMDAGRSTALTNSGRLKLTASCRGPKSLHKVLVQFRRKRGNSKIVVITVLAQRGRRKKLAENEIGLDTLIMIGSTIFWPLCKGSTRKAGGSRQERRQKSFKCCMNMRLRSRLNTREFYVAPISAESMRRY